MMSVWATTALLVCGLAIAPLMLSASQALHQQRDSGARGQAVLLAQDLAHRLHLNASAAAQYQLAWGQVPAALASACRERACSRADWAQADMSQWRAQLTQTLPDGDAWLQSAEDADACRWLVLAWSSDVVDEPPSSGWPVTCPPGKRCLALVLSP